MTVKPSDIIPTERVYDAEDHYEQVLALFDAYPIKCEADAEKHAIRILKQALKEAGKSLDDVTEDFLAAVVSTIETTLETNHFVHTNVPTKFSYRPYLEEQEHRLSEERLKLATETLIELFTALLQLFPPEFFSWHDVDENNGVPLISVMSSPAHIADGICRVLMTRAIPHGDEQQYVFPELTKQITDNLLRANGLTSETYVKSKKVLKFPADFDLEPVEYVDRFLHETAFQYLFKIGVQEPQMPPIPDALKFEHTWCLAAPGAGKTTLILKEVVDNLKRDNPPAMIILDPKGLITSKISSLAVFDPVDGKHRDRLIIIDPTDVTAPPALNMFHPGNAKRFRLYSEATRRQVENQAITLFSYVFASRGNALTAQQATCFNYLVRLLFSMENATIHTMLDIINDQLYDKQPSVDKSPWKAFIERQQPIAQRWFRDQYYHHLVETRKGIATRLYGVLEKPELAAAFSARERKLDLFDALQTGKTVLVKLPKAIIGQEGMELFGRYIIALTLASSFERISIDDRSKWHPAFLYIDEFQEFADDEKSAELLQLAREFNLGVFVAHQDIASQLSDSLKSALATNTSIKYVSAIGGMDASFMAREMNCDPEFFRKALKTATEARFACFVRGLTATPVIVSFPFGAMESEPRMTPSHYDCLLQRNRDLLTEPREDRTLGTAPIAEQAPTVPESQKKVDPITEPASTPLIPDPGDPSDKW